MDSDVSSDMSEILKNDLIYEALNMKETNDYLLNSSTSFSELNTNDTDLIASDLKSLDDIKFEIVHKILENKNNKKNDKKNKEIETTKTKLKSDSKLNEKSNQNNIGDNNENEDGDSSTNKILSIERMSILSKISTISIDIYSLNLKYPSDEQFSKYIIKYSIPNTIPILTNTYMYTQIITDTQLNNITNIKINHSNNINIKFDTQLLKHWIKNNTTIIIEVEAIRDTKKISRSESKDNKGHILWKGIATIKCRDLITLPYMKLKSYIPIYKELSTKNKSGYY